MKPIIPNKYIINNNIIIEYRIFENEDVEIYKTQGGEYFYLLLTIAQLSNKIINRENNESFSQFNNLFL